MTLKQGYASLRSYHDFFNDQGYDFIPIFNEHGREVAKAIYPRDWYDLEAKIQGIINFDDFVKEADLVIIRITDELIRNTHSYGRQFNLEED